jgi:prepilin-type N-terminal cleavage/methylation domain-containing protein
MSRTNGSRKGFTLVELAVVIVIIGVLAAFGVPQFLKSVERSKAAEAFNYLSALRAAQERYLAKNGFYYDCDTVPTDGIWPANATTNDKLDINQSTPKYFTLSAINESHTTAGTPTWWTKLTRKDSSYGNYIVSFDQDGYVAQAGNASGADASDIDVEISPLGAEASTGTGS